MNKIPRKQCPVCRRFSPFYLYVSHVKQCEAERAERAQQVRANVAAALSRLQGRTV